MKIVGLCSFWDESPTWMAAFPAACAKFVDHLIFVDGAYFLYDKDGASSGVEVHDAIARGCHAAGIGHTLYVPETCWIGNEVEKRSFMFRLAEAMTTEDDFYCVIDADTFLTEGSAELARQDLERGEHEAYNCNLIERWDWNSGPDGALIVPQDGSGAASVSDCKLTCVFKAKRGLTVLGAHYLYAYPDETARWGYRALWGPTTEWDVQPAGDLDLGFEHWSKFRPADRRKAATDYYQRRDELKIERTARNFIETVDGGIAET